VLPEVILLLICGQVFDSALFSTWSLFLQGGKNGATPALRPLNLEDFIQSKAKVTI
jgi:hypothetical protein